MTDKLIGCAILGFVALALVPLDIPAEEPDLTGLHRSNVYQRIKDVDENGLSVCRYTGGAGGPTTDILLDEQGVASGGRADDSASRPLFRKVDATKLTEGLYPEFIKLLNNYVVRATERESYSNEEQQEIDAFLDKAVQTQPMKVAYAYIGDHLGHQLTPAQFRQKVERIWFELFENSFGNRGIPYCSGFEHVFVGEGQFPATGTPPRRGEISGYHNWVRFYLQEKAGEVNYLGHKYDLPPSRKPANPSVITLRMIWNYDPDGAGKRAGVELFKPKGGYFVGTSPECELAMGTVAYFEQEEGLFVDDKRRAVIDGATYDLVLYRSISANGGQGPFVRSFYPVLVGLAQPVNDPVPDAGDGPVVIAKAVPNPEGDDEMGEWIELKNKSDVRVDLDGWELRDRQGGSRRLAGPIEPGQVRRFEILRAMHTLRLGNSGGTVRLLHGQELVHEVEYDKAASDEVIQFK